MTVTTAALSRNNEEKLKLYMDIDEDESKYSTLIDITFPIDEDKKKRFRHRITFKDNQITNKSTHDDFQNTQSVVSISEWLIKKQIPEYTNEYIFIKRKEYISSLQTQIENMESNFNDQISYSMHFQLLLNKISEIYNNFLKIDQDENFLSFINLIEEVFKNNEITKKIVRELKSILNSIKNIETFDYDLYEKIVKKFFDAEINIISIHELPNQE